MNRWRPLTWLVVSVACFIAAFYFWRLGDKWQAQRPAGPAAPAGSNAPVASINPAGSNVQLQSTVVQHASTAPVVALNPPATNAVVAKSTNFPYRLSNTTQSLGELSHNRRAILLENALIDLSKPGNLAIPDSLRAHGDPGAYIVQPNGPIDDAFRARLAAAGATRVSYIPNNAYLVTGPQNLAEQLGPDVTVLPWEPYYKIKSALMPSALDGFGAPALNLAVFPGALPETKKAFDQMGVTVTSESASPFGTQVAVQNVSSIAAVAALPGVEAVEPSFQRVPANDWTRVIMSDSSDVFVPTNYLGLSGSNVFVAVADSWVPTNGATQFNPDLPDTTLFAPNNLFPIGVADTAGHATHVAGIIAASGMNSPSNAMGSPIGADFRGKAPAAKIWALPAQTPSVSDAQLQQAAATNSLISNNSWDYGDSDYDLAAASYDQAVRDSVPGATGSQQLIYVFAAGNNGGGGDDGLGGLADSLLSPAVAKNVISVGASELPRNITNQVYRCDACDTNSDSCTTNQPWLGMTDSSNQVARFSSRGNVGVGVEGDFGRFKPDVVAPGTFVVSTRSKTWDTTAYYNPNTITRGTFFNKTVNPGSIFRSSIFVPCDTAQLILSAVSINPTNVDLPIYVRQSDFPTTNTYDVVETNIVSLPPDFPLTETDVQWFYAVGNPTNVPVHFNVSSELIETNSLGDYWDVLRTNLNDLLVTSNGTGPFYRYESGTSMAAPAVSGTLALMEDYFTNRWGYTPSPALMKALLINGARSINPIYDFQVHSSINYQGWGLVNLTNSLPVGITNTFGQSGPTIFVDQSTTNALATGDARTFVVTVNTNAQPEPMRVTLVWTDPPGNPAASIKLVNDLDLIVTNLDDPTNPVVYFGNNFGSGIVYTSPWNGDTNNLPSDNVNNVENVYIPGPLGTNYSITVVARDVNVNAVTSHTNGVVQDFALVISSSEGEITNALTLASNPGATNYTADLTVMTNQFVNSADTSGGLLLGQRVGASSPLQGTNTLSLTNQNDWNTKGQITVGVSNQWHFYVITNTMGTNASVSFTNAAFVTFLPVNLSIPPVGVNAPDEGAATRPEADIDLYVARGSGAWGLTNLDPVVIAGATKSLSRGGTETIVFSNALPNEVFYVGVKAEDQEAAEYAFAALFSQFPFSQMGPNGEEYLHGINVPTIIPDGSPSKAGVARTLALAVQPISIQRVVVTNFIEHENFGDLFGSLMHSRISVVLNNHTFGNGGTNQELIYEDNGQGDIPGSQPSDGPGSLRDFMGQQGIGLWLVTEQDNALFNTGQVDNVFIRLDPQQDTNGVVATVQPNTFFYDFIDVPPNGTNLTVCVNFLPGSTGPVQLYLRYGDFPTTNSYDYTKPILSPGDCLSVNRFDLPPLRPGRYYVGIFNPTATPQTVRLTWQIGLDPNGALPTPITTTNGITPLPDDAVTNNFIFITNNQKIVEVNVGVVLEHPRVSDLDLTLVSPTGQRILLFENRGGPSTTNMGHLNIFTNFFGATASGTAAASTNTISPVPNVGTLLIDYNFFTVPDRIDVYYDNVDIFSTTANGQGTFTIPYGPGSAASISIVMNQGDNPNSTQWMYTPRVVSEDFTYLTFTDDTNLTQTPIKFALPPYDNSDNGTNVPLSDFELATNGTYIANFATPSNNIFDLNGGWAMTTNDVFFVRTNYFTGTNRLSMATNEVSVVTDPFTAANGSNYLALANGSISRTISLTPGKDYDITYLYRGPGISGWWRGEGDATDSGDPETLGNNGGLIGRFNFPSGEVGQAFAFADSGQAFEFAGTNTYVQVRQSPSLDVGAGSGFTVEGWINPTNITFQQPLVEWLARVPTNKVVNGRAISNLVIQAGPFLNRANGHYYYLLSQTNWQTSELWANALGGHLAEVDDANEENWIYDTFAQFGGATNFTMWIGLTNRSPAAMDLVWSTGASNVVYTNWAAGQPTNCSGQAIYTAILGPTNALPGLWTMLDNNGLTCGGATNKPFGVVEVNEIQTNGVQFWISVTNSVTNNVLAGNGRLYANIVDTNNVSHEIFSAPGLIQSNMYQHVALTYNTNTGVAMLYYSGTNVASTNLGIFVPKTGGDVLIGKDMSRITNNFFWGNMDEMSIYSRFLSPAEIAAIYRISNTTSNRNIGKFDPSITPAESLADAEVSFGDTTNIIYGANRNWQVQGFSLRATSNSLPVQITGLEPGMLLDSFGVAQRPPGNLYYLPEQALQALVGSNAFGNWTLEIRDARTGALATNADLVSWQLQFILQTNIAPPIVLNPQSPGTNTVPPGQIAYFTVTVPSWADNATNILVSATAPVDLLFNQTTPPGLGDPNDVTLLANSTGGIGNPVLSTNSPGTSVPPLLRGQTYYLGVRNTGTVPSTVVVRVDFDITTLTNGIPLTSRFNTNELERPFIFNVSSNAIEATFQLLKVSGGDADLVLRKGLPLPSLTNSDYGSFSGSNADDTIYVLTNSSPVPLSAGRWYLDVIKRDSPTVPATNLVVRYSVLAKELDPPAPNIINLRDRVPVNFTAGPGAALTNFFRFSVTNFPITAVTNLGIHFEVYNQTGNGDLTVQTNAAPLAPPFFQSSRFPGNNAEIAFIHTNSALTNLNVDWYLGVPNNETNPISFTILAQIDTNGFPAFPTAEGSGAITRGGALGTNVYHVNNLFDSGPGSLRAAVTHTNGGGTVVFDVSGTVNLTSPLYITNSFLTIAGQTAPSNGVTVAGASTYVQGAHDIVLRYLRFRPAGSVTNPLVWFSSFESGLGQMTYSNSTMPYFDGGWHVDSGSVDLLTNGPPFNSAAYDGNYFIDINGSDPGQISTNVATVPGTTYSLRFAYTKNPNAGTAPPPSAAVKVNGTAIGTVAPNYFTSYSTMNWQTTSFVFTATSPSTTLVIASLNTPGASGVFFDDISLQLTNAPQGAESLQFTNVANVIVDHVSTAYSPGDLVSVLNSSNVTVQWSVLAESLNKTDSLHGGSQVRYGNGDVTFHHNLYADNYSANPRLGDNLSLDFVNNVIFNWGAFAGLSTNDIADNPGGYTNFLNYSANYLIAYTNSVFTNVAFWGGTTNTWIFQTNNFIDTNRNSILDGANTSWGMFTNQYTPFSHPFAIPATAPDEAFIAYERVLDFAGDSLFKRDLLDRSVVQRVRLQPANPRGNPVLAGMVAWWKAENNTIDSVNGNNGVANNITYTPGEVGNGFQFDGTSSSITAPASQSLAVSNLTFEGWIYPTTTAYEPIVDYGGAGTISPAHFWVNGWGLTPTPGVLYANIRNTTLQITSPSVVPPNKWSHVAFTLDVNKGVAALYYNGVQVAVTNLAVNMASTFLPVNLGYRNANSAEALAGYRFAGRMDEVSIYNRALSPCEIAAIYNAGTAGKQSLLSGAATSASTNSLPYADVDQDAIPDFWEITLGENATNFTANADRDGDGYTDLEEYLDWLGVPHALTITNTPVNVDLYQLSGNTGNLLFGVANGTNGTVVLTNLNACASPGAGSVAVFTPTNNFGNVTNGGFGSFTYMVTNTDTMAYFGPVTVSVFVSSVPITNVAPVTNVLVFTNPPDITTNELDLLTVTNTATESITNLTLSYTVSMIIDTNAMIANGWPLTYVSNIPAPVIDANGVITWTPTESQGPGVYIITTVVTDNGSPPVSATNSFRVTVNEVNLPPVFNGTPPDRTNSALITLMVTNAATDPDIPPNPLTYTLLNPPAGANVDANGVITWTPSLAQAPGQYTITNVVTDTNQYALFNNSLSATNWFTVYVTAPVLPFAFTQPAQAVTGSSAQLNGMATPNGLVSVAWFEWGTNTLYGNQTTPVNVGNTFNVAYTKSVITGLVTNVPYHFRLVVSNAFAVVKGFDQVLDEANVVVWGADYVKQAEVPPGLSNVVQIAGAYDHSLALKNNETVVAWGDDTFSQTNVPPGLSGVLAVAGGQYSSMALKNNGTVAAWGGNILAVTNVPAGLNNVVMIAGGTYASLALKSSGTIVTWGANFFNLTNVPAGLNNVVEVAGGSYHSLAIKNDGTVAAWGDNSAGQTNVPPNVTNVVAIAGGNYHSLALRSDGTVVAWGDNSSGQTNVPAGLSNVVAVAAGGFHSLALKSDGTVVAWGDDTAGQTSVPLGLTNVVAISSGYFHSLALTPTLLFTNQIILDLTNGVPQTNSILGGSVIYYRVNVPANADAATNSFSTLGGSLNLFYTTNTPPTITSPNDFLLVTNSTGGTSVVDTASSPQLIPGTTYYLGVQNTNNFTAAYHIEVDFHLLETVTNTIPISTITHTNINGTNGFLLVWFAPTNDLFQVQWRDSLNGTNWNTFTNIVGYHTFINPTNSEFEFFDDGSQTGGFNSFRFYQLILLNPGPPGPVTLTNGVPATNSIPTGGLTFYQVNVPTNADFATNSLLPSASGPLNLWFSTNAPPTITNGGDFLLITNALSGRFTLSTTGSPLLVPGTTYYLGVQNTNGSATTYGVQVDFHLVTNSTSPVTNSIPISTVTHTNMNGTNGYLLVWYAPTNDLFQVQWRDSLNGTNWNTFTNIVGYHTFINPTNSEFEFFDDGSQTGGFNAFRFYELVLLNSAAPGPGPIPLTNGVPTTNSSPTGGLTFYQVNVPTNADFATNSLLPSASGPLNLWFSTNAPPTITNGGDFLLITNALSGRFTLSTTGSPLLVPGTTYYLGVQNTNGSATSYGVQVDFHLVTNSTSPVTNSIPISTVTHTNMNGTNGYLLVWYAPTNDLFQVQWRDSLNGTNWNTFTNVVGYHTFINPTNSEFEFFDDGSQTGGFNAFRFYELVLLNSAAPGPGPIPLTNGVPTTNSIPTGGLTFYQVNVPTNADFATNSLLPSASGPLNLWFSTNAPPTITNGGDFLLITNALSGRFTLSTTGSPLLVPGTTYYLGVQNTNGSATTYGVQVDFHVVTTSPVTNAVPISTITVTNINGTNNFLLVWFAPTNDLFQVQWKSTLNGTNWTTFTNVISYSTFITATNSRFTFLDDGSQTGGFGSGRYYRLILLPSVSSGAIPLTNGVPLIFTTGVGSTNFFSFDITQTNAAVLFELYNLSGNGDLLAQRSNLPVAPPYFASSTNSGTNYEQIVIRTNGGPANLNAISWFLGVPNQSSNPITYTIRATVPTNGILVGGLPLNSAASRPGGSNMQLTWGPTVNGERYEIRTNGSLLSGNWGVLTDIIVSGTSAAFTDPTPAGATPSLFYRIVQVP
jgi:subtilisin-like proprotein convertase family protein